MAPFAEGLGALAAPLAQPFVSHDVGYSQAESGQKSRKVRNLMLQSPFKSMLARTAIFALVLALAISFVTVGLAPSATAQTADDDPCTVDANDATMVACSYDENSTDPVADFSAMDPEGEGIDWAVEGTDAADFAIDGGVLTFEKAPNYEMPSDRLRAADTTVTPNIPEEAAGNNVYLVTVRATELLAEGQDPPALSSVLHITVTVGRR